MELAVLDLLRIKNLALVEFGAFDAARPFENRGMDAAIRQKRGGDGRVVNGEVGQRAGVKVDFSKLMEVRVELESARPVRS